MPSRLLEIALHVGSFLNKRTIHNCVLVSHQWHQSFLPSLWNNVSLNGIYRSMYPPPETVALHRRLIRYLAYGEMPAAERLPRYQVTFPEVVALRLHYLPWSPWSNEERSVWNERDPTEDFLKRHRPFLRSLTLDSHFDELKDETAGDLDHSIWRMIVAANTNYNDSRDGDGDGDDHEHFKRRRYNSVQSLRSLSLHRVTFHWREMDACPGLWDLLKNLETLKIQIWSYARIPVEAFSQNISPSPPLLVHHPIQSRMVGAKIQHLTLQHCQGGDCTSWGEITLIQQCQELRSLSWLNPNCLHASLLASGVLCNRWPFLDSIDLAISGVQDSELAIMIEGLASPLRQLSVQSWGFSHHACGALLNSGNGRHRATLETLKIPGAKLIPSHNIQKILCSFPRLTTLHAVSLTDLDIWQDSRPWVCLQMRDFRVSLSFTLATPVPEESLFSQALKYRRTRQPIPGTPLPPRSTTTTVMTNFSEEEQEEDTTKYVFLDRLAELTCLETLLIGNREKQRRYYIGPPPTVTRLCQTLELAHGLERLKPLRWLQRLDMIYTYMDLSLDELVWMREHWPELNEVGAYYLNPSNDTTRYLWSWLKTCGIRAIR